jgi:8-oxo-dGTP pyrophosphatase MutT (NUDIX family)
VSDPRVRAAGGIVLRDVEGTAEVLLVHRPRYDDWSLPKGKLAGAESDRDGALREVLEETGCRCRAGEEVGRVRYLDARGRDKEVVYYSMTVLRSEPFLPTDEVDEVRWVALDAAADLLTWDRDADLLRTAVRS